MLVSAWHALQVFTVTALPGASGMLAVGLPPAACAETVLPTNVAEMKRGTAKPTEARMYFACVMDEPFLPDDIKPRPSLVLYALAGSKLIAVPDPLPRSRRRT